ncbi:MAG: class I SAM-dependent methyltransferase [Candidatus Omnitrophica bacterium]|nr:class I SAM-dependent methyltransferase [Candidatus Omnitrophota bacterium]
MKKMASQNLEFPKAQDWNNYWGMDQTQRFTRLSWSKKRILRILQPYILREEKALDAGCGSGFFSEYFCEQGMNTTALDYSQTALDLVHERTNGRVHIMKANLVDQNLNSLTSDKFNIIFTDGLLEHFSPGDQDKIIKNLTDVLHTNGVMINFVPNRWSPWELIRPMYMPGIVEDPFTLSELTDLHERNNLKIIARGGVNVIPCACSPDALIGSRFGMLLFTIAKKQ